jgi:hypothetical protein
MRVKWPIVATLFTVGLAYAAYPYVTLYRLGNAIRVADAGTLQVLVDWPAVREGIKEDICDLVVDEPDTKSSSTLPPFGASFMRGIASSTIDRTVTPQALLAATGSMPSKSAEPERGADVHVNWAFFDSPTTFLVSLQAPGQSEPIKLEMDLRHGAWQIRRVWLPAELLSDQPART